MTTEFLEAQPALRVADLDAARRFYEQIGFVPRFRNGDVHLTMRRDRVTVHLSTIEGGVATCQIVDRNVTDLFNRIQQLGIEVMYDGLNDREWGCRDFTIRDPDGNAMTFSEPQAHEGGPAV